MRIPYCRTWLFLGLSFFFLGGIFVFAQESWFGASQLQFSTGGNRVSTIFQQPFSVGTGMSGFWVRMSNSGAQPYPMRLVFVDQMLTADGMGNASCDMVSGASFGNHLVWDSGLFLLSPQSSVEKRVDFNYPLCSSGVVRGCAVQLLSGSSSGSLDIVVGKANLISFSVQPGEGCMSFVLKVFPGSRPGGNYENIGEVRFYDTSYQLVAKDTVTTNAFGTGLFTKGVAPGTYYVVYKGQSHLASYLTNVVITGGTGMVLDFTTGMNLNNVQKKSLIQDDGFRYQMAGDLKNIVGVYDFMVNGNDIAILTKDGFFEGLISSLEPKNLNADDSINISDLSVIGVGFEYSDPFLSSSQFVW